MINRAFVIAQLRMAGPISFGSCCMIECSQMCGLDCDANDGNNSKWRCQCGHLDEHIAALDGNLDWALHLPVPDLSVWGFRTRARWSNLASNDRADVCSLLLGLIHVKITGRILQRICNRLPSNWQDFGF